MGKKSILNILMGLCAILFLTNSSCNPDPDENGPMLSVQPTAITLEANGTGQTVRVSSNTTWTAVPRDSWLKCSPAGGTGGNSITVSADINTGAERFSKLTLSDKTGRAEVEVHVTQKKGESPTPSDPMLTAKPSSLSFNSSASSNSFAIESNTTWTVKSDQTWCTVNTSSGSNNGIITVNVTENKSTSARNATITINSDKVSSVQVSISQSGATPVFQVDKHVLSFSALGGSDTFSITSNISWSVTSNQSWCTVSSFSGSNDGTITVTVLENTSTDQQSALITVKAGEETQTIVVIQDGAKSVESFTVRGVNFDMIRVEGGNFTMGATSEQDEDAWEDEKPAHQVTLSSYYIGETEVTTSLWNAVMSPNSSNTGGNWPARSVSWDDCQEFITKLNELTGLNFRLPTEAEWEFAARGGNKSRGYKYAGSNNIDDVAWYWVNSRQDPHEVATKQPNELGLYDMSGNVREWCNDWYGSYSSSPQTNPVGPASGSDRVYRGGSFEYYNTEIDGTDPYATGCRVSCRHSIKPSHYGYDLGLRLAL